MSVALPNALSVSPYPFASAPISPISAAPLASLASVVPSTGLGYPTGSSSFSPASASPVLSAASTSANVQRFAQGYEFGVLAGMAGLINPMTWWTVPLAMNPVASHLRGLANGTYAVMNQL